MGFLPARRDLLGLLPALHRVSIPQWVFSPSRPPQHLAGGRTLLSFQSRSGFSPRRDLSECRRGEQIVEFQSRSGFSPRRDVSRVGASRPSGCGFNPAVGFLPVATADGNDLPVDTEVFQSRSGFSPRRDPPHKIDPQRRKSFNPAVGFLPVATRPSGARRRPSRVSIPQWVFSPSRLLTYFASTTTGSVSIPQWVFSPSRLDVRGAGVGGGDGVSIPQWVFSPSRLVVDSDSDCVRDSFNPAVGFLPVATLGSIQAIPTGSCFNPAVGFLPVATWPTATVPRRSSCFNPAVGFLPVATSVGITA